MHLTFASSLLVAAAAATASSPVRRADAPEPQYTSEVTVVQPLKSVVVKLECLGCPLISWDSQSNTTSLDSSRENFLLLKFDIDSPSQRSVLLNKDSIQPFDIIPPRIKAAQIPSNIEQNVLQEMLRNEASQAWNSIRNFPLYYNHSLLPNGAYNQVWLQFDVNGLVVEHKTDDKPARKVALDKEGQKMVQFLVNRIPRSTELEIQELHVVERKDRRMPYKMPCGKPAITQTSYDPNEWDQYGKLGTWERTWNLIFVKTGRFIAESLQKFMIVAPIGVLLALSIVLYRRRYPKKGDRDFDTSDEETDFPLLESYYEGAPPEYDNVPVIKVEEYD